jgi:CheY-like chemotaxis protein
VELLGGTITLRSAVGEGSTFCFTIPYQLVSTAENGGEIALAENTVDCSKYSILIVEDDVYNAQYLEEVLLDTGINILKVTNAKDAFDTIHSDQHIDLILMDIGLPGIGGLEAVRIIKKSDPKIRIIVQTAYTSNDDKKSAFISGCDDFLSKPINSDLVINSLLEQIKIIEQGVN